ncbi:MAG: pyridoxine 5'-phosphate synthase [Bacteroidota bacterium]
MIDLSVNLNKVALIRNSRGRNLPNVLQVAQDCIRFGADGITVHPRPDERHARYQDVHDLKGGISVELNVEGYPSERFLQMVEATAPAQCTLVPDPPGALTSDAGWDTIAHETMLKEVIDRLKARGIRTSIFIETDLKKIDKAREIGTDRIELYTEHYASQHALGNLEAVQPYATACAHAHSIGLGVNAGHDLNLDNLTYFAEHLPDLREVSIGHALVCDALYLGMEETIRRYQTCLGK